MINLKKYITIIFHKFIFPIMFIFGISPIDIAHVTADIISDNYHSYVENGEFISIKEGMNWLNKELKSEISKDDLSSFRVVTKDELIVRKSKKVNSRISGKLYKTDVVQILEKRKNWTYILYSNYEEDDVIEGWVQTRYIKQIK